MTYIHTKPTELLLRLTYTIRECLTLEAAGNASLFPGYRRRADILYLCACFTYVYLLEYFTYICSYDQQVPISFQSSVKMKKFKSKFVGNELLIYEKSGLKIMNFVMFVGSRNPIVGLSTPNSC